MSREENQKGIITKSYLAPSKHMEPARFSKYVKSNADKNEMKGNKWK
jgi:hypothetical protein